jgi:hypothetical protein
MYRLFATAFHEIGDRPKARFDIGCHRWCHFQRTMRLAKVVVAEVQRNGSLKVFQLFAERIR